MTHAETLRVKSSYGKLIHRKKIMIHFIITSCCGVIPFLWKPHLAKLLTQTRIETYIIKEHAHRLNNKELFYRDQATSV